MLSCFKGIVFFMLRKKLTKKSALEKCALNGVRNQNKENEE